jgi:hypothetical protein
MGLNKPGTRLTWTEAITKFDEAKIVDLKTFDVNPNKFLGLGNADVTSSTTSQNGNVEIDTRTVKNSSPVTKKPTPLRRITARPTRKPLSPSIQK